MIPPNEFYRRPLEAGPSVSDKPRHHPPNLAISRFSGKNPNSTPETSHDSLDDSRGQEKGLTTSSSLGHNSNQSQLPSVVPSKQCNEPKEIRKRKRKHHKSSPSRDSSGHGRKRKRSASHGHTDCPYSMWENSFANGATPPPLESSSKRKKIKGKKQGIVPSTVPTGTEDDKSSKPTNSSSPTQPTGSRHHGIDLLRDSTASETITSQSPASGTPSKFSRRDERDATSSSPTIKKRRRVTPRVHRETSRQYTNGQVQIRY